MHRHLRRSVITKVSTVGNGMKHFLPSVTSLTKTYFIITHMFPNYDTSEKTLFFQQV